MRYALVVPERYRRSVAARSPEDASASARAKARRKRIVEVLRLACDDPPPHARTRAQRMRVVEVLRLQAGLTADAPLPRGRPEVMNIEPLVEEWEEGQRKLRGHLADLGLSQDMHGRLHCAACGEWVPASTRGFCGGSMRALAWWHGTFCTAGKEGSEGS